MTLLAMNRKLVYLGICLLGLLVFYPALTSYFFADDFAYLAISRHLRNPLSLFNHDHFIGSFYYRPLGMLLWWLSCHLFGTQYFLHNLVNILIHVGSACALFRIFSLVNTNQRLNVLMVLLFLVHPASISTTAWLSDRFDLLATLSILLALYWFLRYRLDGIWRGYYLALAASVLAILSKEQGYLTPLLVTSIALSFRPDATRSWRRTLGEIAPFYGVALAVLGVRFALLRGTEKYLMGDTLPNALVGGVSKWLRMLPDFYVFYTNFARFNVGVYALLIAAILVLAGLGLRALARPGVVNWSAVALGLAIALLPAIVQAPVTHTALTFTPDGSFSFSALANSRYYYLSLAGFALVAQQLLSAACVTFTDAGVRRAVTRLVYCVLAALVMMYAILSYSLCIDWSKLTNSSDRRVIEQVNLAVAQLQLPRRDCKLYILNSYPASTYFREYSDSMIKAFAPTDSQVIHCLVLTEKTPFYQIVLREDLEAMRIAPLQYMTLGGQAIAPTLIDTLAYVFLTIPNADAVSRDANAVFIEFDGTRFVDVSQQVRSGEKKVNFFDDHPRL